MWDRGVRTEVEGKCLVGRKRTRRRKNREKGQREGQREGQMKGIERTEVAGRKKEGQRTWKEDK